MSHVYRVPLVLAPQDEGGYTVTSPVLPGLVTEGDSLEQALENVQDALRATLELYEETGRPVPTGLVQDPDAGATVLPDWGGKDLELGTVCAAVRDLGIDWEVFLKA